MRPFHLIMIFKRWTLRRGSEKELSPVLPSPPSVPEASPGPESRLSRLFSLRRSVGPCAAPTLDQVQFPLHIVYRSEGIASGIEE